MDSDIDDVIAANLETPNGVVQRKRDVDDGPSGDWEFPGRKEHGRWRPQSPDLLVADDREVIVENERPRQAVRVRQAYRKDDDGAAQPEGPRPAAPAAFSP